MTERPYEVLQRAAYLMRDDPACSSLARDLDETAGLYAQEYGEQSHIPAYPRQMAVARQYIAVFGTAAEQGGSVSSGCSSCGRPGEPYTYKGIEFDGLCPWKGERLCKGCRDARMSLIEQAARHAPVGSDRRPALGTVSTVRFPICPSCWHETDSHCGGGAHTEGRFGPVCVGGGKHCDQCPGNRCRIMVPITDRHGNVLILTPDRAASYYPKESRHEASA